MPDGSSGDPEAGSGPARRQRADARVAIAVERMGAGSGARHVAESGSARLRLPRTTDGVPEAVLINTGGGIASGDRFAVEAEAGPGARLVLTTAAAEKAYRSDGAIAEVATTLRVAAGARLDWLPQETILFDAARLRRSLDVAVAPDGSALLFEMVVFGRAAFGETCRSGLFVDRWRVRRGGRLAFAETLRLEGAIAERLARPAVANGARAVGTLLWIGPDAEAALEPARAALEEAGSECGASAFDGLLLARFCAADAERLRRDAARLITCLRGRPMPRVWNL